MKFETITIQEKVIDGIDDAVYKIEQMTEEHITMRN